MNSPVIQHHCRAKIDMLVEHLRPTEFHDDDIAGGPKLTVASIAHHRMARCSSVADLVASRQGLEIKNQIHASGVWCTTDLGLELMAAPRNRCSPVGLFGRRQEKENIHG